MKILKPQSTLTSYGVECLLRQQGVQVAENAEKKNTILCALCVLCGYFFMTDCHTIQLLQNI